VLLCFPLCILVCLPNGSLFKMFTKLHCSRCSIPVLKFAVNSYFLPIPLYALTAWFLYLWKTNIYSKAFERKQLSYIISEFGFTVSPFLHDRHIWSLNRTNWWPSLVLSGCSLPWKRRLGNSIRADKHRTISSRQYWPPATQTAFLPSVSQCVPSWPLSPTATHRTRSLDRTRRL
jgi:hypothetical protein